ncbi:YdeI/OmpD-associated family protein [Gloeobacter violaceus]|uniref:Gll0036 protein n=1 Tax=Gloeobacter violaceus (strain ATCC 29082 / PCC 7421) TaxID=251221 RepID=Q7NPL9_GLOVI|nr:YdeI/OmpD-associated family protein [Gloeobacter violaceus]BAC87977.1 gll0036 [Gloeobacter violaceus PCC 7421]
MTSASPSSGRSKMVDFERVLVTSRAEWRGWLTDNHTRTKSIWLVTYKKRSGMPHVPYDVVVEEALCFGWIDSRPGKLDERRSMLLLSPRRSGSPWSKINKARVERLIEQGLMTAVGMQKIEQAQADSSWSVLDGVESLVIPSDLAAALAENSQAAVYFAAFSPSSKKGILQWIQSAKREETRRKRIAETIELAANNIKANFPRKA